MTIKWMQWETRNNGLKAFAVDSDAELKNGIVRAVNGAVVPEDAEPAKPSTPQDAFCISIIEKKAHKPEPKAPKTPKPPVARLKVGKTITRVVFDKQVVGEFETDKLDMTEGVDTVVKVSDKTWAVYQNKKRVSSGKLVAETIAA